MLMITVGTHRINLDQIRHVQIGTRKLRPDSDQRLPQEVTVIEIFFGSGDHLLLSGTEAEEFLLQIDARDAGLRPIGG
jgi:hypothetical protein